MHKYNGHSPIIQYKIIIYKMMTLWFFILIGYISAQDNGDLAHMDPKYITGNYTKGLFTQIVLYYENLTEIKIITDYVYQKPACIGKIIETMTKSGGLEIINFSGKTLSDTGLEDDCKSRNYTYLFLTYELDLPVYFNDSDYSSSYYTFMGQKSFYLGLCLYMECMEFYEKFLDGTANKKLFTHLESQGIRNLTLYEMDYIGNTRKEEKLNESGHMELVLVFFYLFLFYIIFRCIITFAGLILYDKDDTSECPITGAAYELSLGSSQCDEVLTATVTRKKKSKFYRFFKILTFINFKILNSVKNKYFDDTHLELICGVRMYLLFLMTLHQNIYSISRLPHSDPGGYSFYISIWYFIAKYASYATECLIAVNGIIFGYKLMNYHKYKSDGSLFSYMKFYFNFLTKVMVFFLSFVVFHLLLKEVSFYFGNLTFFDYFMENFVYNKECYEKPWTALIPFYLQYITPEDNYSTCFKYSNFITCELIGFTFIIVLFYILQKIESRKLDFLPFVANIVNLGLLYFNFDTNGERYYTYDDVLGETLTITKPHLFIIPYFLGFNIGVIYFYYKDLMYGLPGADEYMPFYYNFYIMKFLDTKSNAVKQRIICLSMFLQLFISLNFYIIVRIANYGLPTTSYNILFKKDLLIDIITIYQNKLFVILFLITVLTVLITNKDLPMKNFFSASIFVPLNRMSFTFFCMMDSIIYIFYAMYNIQTYSSIQNLIFLSLGLLLVITFSSLAGFILFELPFRLAYKTFVADKRSKVRLK
jgi:hypothetical protein